MSEINLKMLPKSLIDFNKENQAIHHYNGSSLEQWFCKSIEEWCKTFGCFLEQV